MKFTNTDRKWCNQVYWRMDEQVYGQVYKYVNCHVVRQLNEQAAKPHIRPIQIKIKEEINK